jgi:chromosomal replication initiator protein
MDVVSSIRCELIERIGQERFGLWFTSSVRLELSEDTLIVTAADQFLLERLRKQFMEDLSAVSRQVAGVSQTVFRVDDSLRRTAKAEKPTRANEQDDCASVPLSAVPPSRPAGARKFAHFSSFSVGGNNQVAHAAAMSVARRPGEVSPLFLYGPAGCGKTHLLEGIWSDVRQNYRRSRILFLSAEQFTSYFLVALRGSGLPNFRSKCREVDLLAIDDVQFFAGKRATIIELQHTMDSLLRAGRQLILAADRPPVGLTDLGNEMIARFTGGLICGLDHADYTTRLDIARRKAAQLEITMPEEVLTMLAQELPGDARQIQGALHRLEATSVALKQSISVSLARVTLRDVFRATQPVVRLPDIERAVCDTFGLDPKTLRQGGKTKSVSQPRMLAMWLARKYTRAAFAEISQYFGRRSHSTVISAEKKVNCWMSEDASIQLGQEACQAREAVQRIELRLRSG